MISILALLAPLVMFGLVLAFFIVLVRFGIKAFYRAQKPAPDAK